MDPLDLIDQYGADALRFTLTALAAQGRDIKLSTGRIEGYRNFVTKLWNASRYAEMNGCVVPPGFAPASAKLTVNRWIAGEVSVCERDVTQALAEYRYNDAAGALYHFTWHTFCDWYLEFTKPILADKESDGAAETRAMTAWVIEQLLHLMHPFMPFVTEELWEKLSDGGRPRDEMLVTASWPRFDAGLEDKAAREEMGWVVRLIERIRAVRTEINVPPAARLNLTVKEATTQVEQWLSRHQELIERLARISLKPPDLVGIAAIAIDVKDAVLLLHIGTAIVVADEMARLNRELDKADKEIAAIDKKLDNPSFVTKAPAEVVEELRQRRADYAATKAKLEEALERLASL
jgi:valyl-tRNA synthetase